MCYLYPQVYNDGCEVKVTPKKTSCVPCAGHARVFQITRQPCGVGKVVVSTFGLCPEHEQPTPPPPPPPQQGDDGVPLSRGARRHQAIVGQRHPRPNDGNVHGRAQDGGPNGSWFDIDVDDDGRDEDKESDASSSKSRGSSSSLTAALWGGWMAKVWGSSGPRRAR